MLEMPAAGGVVPTTDILLMRIGHLYPDHISVTILATEGVMLLMVLVYTGIELSNWRRLVCCCGDPITHRLSCREWWIDHLFLLRRARPHIFPIFGTGSIG